MYSVRIEPEHALMHIRVTGFWDAATMRGYREALGMRAGQLGAVGGCRRILVDMSAYPIQAQDIAEGHGRIAVHGRDVMRARLAIVMTSSLSRLQAKRIANLGGSDLFDDETSARAWLLAA